MQTLLVFLLATAAFAQNAGTITGTVLDLGGDKVAKAPVQATNTATNAVYRAASSDTGIYTLAQVPPGVYNLLVLAPGFNPYAQQNASSGLINSPLTKHPPGRRLVHRKANRT